MLSVEVAASPEFALLVTVTSRHPLYVRRGWFGHSTQKIRKPMNADGVMDNIRNAFGRSGVTRNELGDDRVLTAQSQSSGRGSCCITRQARVFRQCYLSLKRWMLKQAIQ